ncbi:MAG: DUF362 domain-containing protein, partial [Candidatus Heimdallarchaeaceae archaeon]
NILIKPNMVLNYTYNRKGSLDELVTNPSVIKPLLDYSILALRDKGKIVIGDAPIQKADFKDLTTKMKLSKMVDEVKNKTNVKINIIDFRREIALIDKRNTVIERKEINGDPEGYTEVNLKENSALSKYSKNFENFRVTQYDKRKMRQSHNKIDNKYLIANSVLHSDLIISIPKLKTHRKAGMTASMKNLIGINGSKDYLPHHRKGSVEENGDEYLYKSVRKKIISDINERINISKNSLIRLLLISIKNVLYVSKKIMKFKDSYYEGSWWGNDTIARTIIDLNRIILYSDKTGEMSNKKQRKMLAITDSVIAGEGDGPLNPTAKKVGLIISSASLIANDIVCAYIMGFDYLKIPTLKHAIEEKYKLFDKKRDMCNIKINDYKRENIALKDIRQYYSYNFEPSNGWKDHIELKED